MVTTKMPPATAATKEPNMQEGEVIHSSAEKYNCNQTEEKGEDVRTLEAQSEESTTQIQQIYDVVPVATQVPSNPHHSEIEASKWINSHILELSSTCGAAFEGFREENTCSTYAT